MSPNRHQVLTTWTELSAQPPIHRAGRRRFTDEELRAVFDSIDTSGDGEICVAELQVAIRTVDPKADDIDKARSEGYSDMIDQVDMEEVLLNAAAANDGKFTDAWRELGQSVRDQPDEWQRESVVSGVAFGSSGNFVEIRLLSFVIQPNHPPRTTP